MARRYRLTLVRRVANRLVTVLLRAGLWPRPTYLLAVRGRRSGRLRTTPVILVEQGAARWLVAPYGEVEWVRNARAAGRVTLSRGRRSEEVGIIEANSDESAPILKEYLRHVPLTRPFFNVAPDSPVEAFQAEAHLHPVFRVVNGPVR